MESEQLTRYEDELKALKKGVLTIECHEYNDCGFRDKCRKKDYPNLPCYEVAGTKINHEKHPDWEPTCIGAKLMDCDKCNFKNMFSKMKELEIMVNMLEEVLKLSGKQTKELLNK